jgi:uncharacterized RDD family membrane protein YckC
MAVEIKLPPSSLWLRTLAAIIDSLVVTLIWYFIIDRFGHPDAAGGDSASFGSDKVVTGAPAMLLFLATAAFWIIPEWLASATLGKLLCGLRVASLDGREISFSQSIKRNLLRLLDAFPFYLTGFVAAALSPRHQRLGDVWAKTIVVRKRHARAPSASSDSPHPAVQ